MNNIKTLITIIIYLSLTSCYSPPVSVLVDRPKPNTVPTPMIIQQEVKSTTVISPANTEKTINITLYTSDAECQRLIPQTVSVSAKKAIADAVGKTLAKINTKDLNLSGYRVNVKNRIATIDLRISTQSPRQLVSLSNCEQLALFGSLRKTLTSHSQWHIQEVYFTQQGQPVTTK